MTTASPTPPGPRARRPRGPALLAAWLVLGTVMMARDAASLERLAAPVPTSPPATAVAPRPDVERAPIRVRFEAPPGTEGSPRPLLGTLRVEDDDGRLAREVEVRGERLEILDVPAGAWVLRAHVAGFARAVRAIRTTAEGDGEEIVLALSPIARVAGQLSGLDGLPHQGTVRIVGSGIWPGRELAVGPDGRFVFEDVPSGIYEVEARHEALVAEPRRGLTVDPETSAFVSLRLAEGGFVLGQVLDARGRGVAGAEVLASTAALSASSRAALSGASGEFRVGPFTAGPVSVDVRASGFVSEVAAPCRTDAPCRITLGEGATLRGRVLDSAREPIANAWVEVVGEASDRAPIAVSATVLPLAPLLFPTPADSALPSLSASPSLAPSSVDSMPGLGVTDEVPPIPLLPSEPHEAPSLVATGGAASSTHPTVLRTSLRTDGDGHFVVSGLPPGRVEVIARAPGHRAARSPRLLLSSGRTREDVELVLEPGGRVAGLVLDERSRPADAHIEVRVEGDPIPRYLATDARGRFVVEDVGGTVLLSVTSEGRPAHERVLDVAGGETEDVAITLDAGRRRVRARVLDPHGDPVPDALVRVETLTAGTGQPRTLVSDANGEVTLEPAPPGLLSMEASHPRWTSAPVVVRGDELVTLPLEIPLSVATTLLDAWSGAGIADAEITWTCLDGDPCFRSTSSTIEGVVELPRARAGRYRVEVRAPGYAPLVRDLEIRAPRRGDVVELDPFVIEPGLRVRGDVVDRFGRVVPSVEVGVEAPDTRDALVARTDDHGQFVIEGVPAGRRAIVATHASAGAARLSLEVRRDRDPAPIVIRLPERFDDDPSHGDRARRVIGVAVTIDDAAPIITRVDASGARRAGLLEGDVIEAIDGAPVLDSASARALLCGPSFVPGLLQIRRGAHTFFVRAPHELH